MHQLARATLTRGRTHDACEACLVVAVWNQNDLLSSRLAVSRLIQLQRAWCHAYYFCRAGRNQPLHPAVRTPKERLLRPCLVQHGIAKIRDPRQPAELVKGVADKMSGGHRVGCPDRLRPISPDQGQAGWNGAEQPGVVAIGQRKPGRISTPNGNMPCNVQCKCALDRHRRRNVHGRFGRTCRICAFMRRQQHGFPAEFREVLHEAQRALDTAAAFKRREMVRDHQDAAAHGRFSRPGPIRAARRTIAWMTSPASAANSLIAGQGSRKSK